MFGGVSCSFGNWCEIFFVSSPNVFIKTGSACVAGSANALEAGLVTALVNCAPLRDGILKASGICAENDLGTPVDVAIG